jgi:hypothetical protein
MTTWAEAQARISLLLGMMQRGRVHDHGTRPRRVGSDPFKPRRPRPPTYMYQPVEDEDEQTGEENRTYWAQ